MGWSNFIDAEKWSKRLDLPYVERFWYKYNLGGGWGNRYGSTKKAYPERMGKICNFSGKNLAQGLNLILDSIIAGDWNNVCNLYGGLIAFCLKYCASDITYYEDNRTKYSVSVKRCCEELKFPTWCRSRLEKIFKMKLSFEDYLHAFDDVEHVNFDVDTALMIYKMQGDNAIFSILMQLFSSYTQMNYSTANLVDELPIIWTPKVSDFVTGTSFPVVATRFSNKFKWKRINDGFFLIDEFNNVVDCASVGHFNVFNENLGNRLSFLSRSGLLSDYVICWCWGDLIDAVGLYNGDILVRNLSYGFDGWFRFGLGGKLAVWLKDGNIYGVKGNKYLPDVHLESYPNEGRWPAIANLNKERVDDVIGEEVCWSLDEIRDWFEIGDLCKEKLKKE